MLQQTTVGAVRGRYERFLARFPTLDALARSSEDQVLAAWAGLGYYGRARNLRRAARAILRDHGGQLPHSPQALRRLPGFGEYTAAAVAAIAYGVAVPAVDANVTRVLSRLFALPGVAGSRAHREKVFQRAKELMPRHRPGDFTAALMDLGQLICTPRRPGCPRCPLAGACEANRSGRPERYPARRANPRPVRVAVAAAEVRLAGRTLLVRRRETLLSGMWAYPSAQAATLAEARRRLAAKLSALGVRLQGAGPLGHTAHTVVNRRLAIVIYAAGKSLKSGARALQKSLQSPKSTRWFRPEDFARAAIPTLTRKIAVAAGFLRR